MNGMARGAAESYSNSPASVKRTILTVVLHVFGSTVTYWAWISLELVAVSLT